MTPRDWVIQTFDGRDLLPFRVPEDAPSPERYAVSFAQAYAEQHDIPLHEIVVTQRNVSDAR